ncbi:MAG: phage tail protein [Acidobacteriota bacterium]
MKRSEIEWLLPRVFRSTCQPGTVLWTALEVMEAFHAPAERRLEELPRYFSPYATPDPFLPLLATWVDLDWLWQVEGRSPTRPLDAWDQIRNLSCGLGRVRDLIAAAAKLSKWRGTGRGLIHLLELATGRRGFQIDESVSGPDGRPIPFHIRVRVPGKGLHQALIRRIVEEEKPAHVTFELRFEDPEA